MRNFVSVFAAALIASQATSVSACPADVSPQGAWDHPAYPLPEHQLHDGNSEWAINGVHLEPPALQEAETLQPTPDN